MSRRSLLGAGPAIAVAATVAAPPVAAAASRPGGRVPWSRLQNSLGGRLVLPADADYERAKRLASAQFDDVRPQAVAYCVSAADVAAALRFAQHYAVPRTVRSGGHNFLGWSSTEGLVIDVSRMHQVQVGPDRVRLGPGAQAVDVLTATAPHGITVPSGFCPTVCPGGFVAGGGMGWQFRKYGPASDRLVAARVVLADGRVVTASAGEHPDLFWALRGGGGGNFGVVTEFDLKPTVEPSVVMFTLNWPWDQALTVFSRWQQWAEQTPPDLAPRAGLLLNDAKPGAVPTVIVTGVHLGHRAEADALLDELVALVGSAPSNRSVAELPYREALMRQFGCGTSTTEQCHLTGTNPEALLPRASFVLHRGRMIADAVPDAGLAAMITAFDADRRPGQYRWLGFTSLGKNANLVPPDATAWVHRDATIFGLYTVGLPTPAPAAEEHAAAVAWAGGGFAAMEPHSSHRSYVNYPDAALTDPALSYYGRNLSRLAAVKRRYDPHDCFHLPQGVRG
ncbi:FAD-dependent oxidoreductase [Dactylosporangium sp. NPDC051484]|uniref:FAD-dependent oxidoreductase n=1 Tax=Dactylosporangium sp. NPDC051484 TaxID=3154942 RepID=UPI00344E6748